MIAGLLKTTAKAVAWLPAGWARALALHWGWLLARVVHLRRGYVLATLGRCFPGAVPDHALGPAGPVTES